MRAESCRLSRAAAGAVALLAALWLSPVPAADVPATEAPAGEVAPTLAADPRLEADVQELSHKLRCLVCQNQSIAESNAPLALDLRNQVREQLAAGRSKQDVIDYLVERYGDFVLYEPPVKGVTLLLWGGPAVLLLAGIGWLAYRVRRRAAESAGVAALSEAEHARARALLAGTEPADAPPSSATRESRS